ncbi:solute carrier family 22 member 18 isoform X2 [Eublepharis macularius]|uniref:Organic cation transporter-like protein 2 n=1 Tax=Eublepharis macularius TaxID=481883 RepID=A0AA97IXR3_EUBMA|nr:solute carrier family 22 member 18 isoform X2 [Eublepharis macularius]
MNLDIHLEREQQNLERREESLWKHDTKSVDVTSRQWVIRATYLITTIGLTCLFMQFGIVPYLATSLGLDAVGFGYLQTLFGVLQLLGSPIFGRFSDQFGARAALTLSYVASSLVFLLLSMSTNVLLLFLSRIPFVFMHALPGAQIVITDLTTPAEHADALGKLGLCFGIGIIIGSSLGGSLATKFGIYFPCYVALIGELTCLLMVLLFIPAQTKSQTKENATQHSIPQSSSVFSLKEITRLLTLPGIMDIFLIKVLSGLPVGLFLIMFSIIAINFFDLEAAQAGYLMSYFGVLQMVFQGLVIGRLTHHYAERTLLMLSVSVFGGVGLAMALMTNVFQYCIIAFPMVFAFCTLGIITDVLLTKSVPPSDTGAILGISASVIPLTRAIGPTIGGFLYGRFGVSSFGYLQLIISVALFLYISKKKIPLNEDKVR